MSGSPLASLRRSSLEARRAMSAAERRRASKQICAHVIRSHEFAAARHIACYLPMDDEVDPGRIIARAWRAGKQVFVPVVGSRHEMRFANLEPDTSLIRNRFGIWEPQSSQEIAARELDLVITPLAAFDSRAERIGMGGGFYDRHFAFLKHRRCWRRPKLVGVAFACQEVTRITPNPWDVRLYAVVSEQGWKVSRSSNAV